MTKIAAGDLQQADLVRIISDLQARVKALELQAGVRSVTFVSAASSTSSTTLTRMAWTTFPRSGSSVTVDVSVTLSGASSCEVQLRADGTQIDSQTVTASGVVTVSGFLPEGWAFGARKVVDVQAKVGSGSATVAVVGGWHR
ncbi:hypothetical protein GCM10027187_40820 [Streptosporangium sandarakinum]|uniref:Uncharacterized protein n=1 Tax=Streptosporangium sandarakinum TaxID=1260955 RepID=A0A852V8Y6_9ACTN|nr:hypothetical protein [Streptosporangium sandarakinum]NYF44586.1 hypothetical protein [Streptosporangium sandarakinum]